MRRRRTLWIILLAVPLLLLAADTLYWRIIVRNLEAGFAEWESNQRAAGWIVQHAAPVRGGWPLAAILTVPAMSLTGGAANIPGGLSWSAERLLLRIALARPTILESATAGRQQLRLAGGPEVPYTASRVRLLLPLTQPASFPASANLTVGNLHADTPLGGEASIGSLRLHLEFRPDAHSGEPAVSFSLHAEAISPPKGVVRPLGPRITALTAEGALNGPLPIAKTPVQSATVWRDGGGSLEIRHLAVVWGPLDLTGSATLALDDQLQPMGAGSARLVGYAETLDALAAHALISRSAATAAKAVLSLLANSPDDGSPPDVEVPLTLQYRTLSMRQVPLLRLPEVDWP
jgi:hypothetical protein